MNYNYMNAPSRMSEYGPIGANFSRPRTAITDLDAFLNSLPPDERTALVRNPEFSGMHDQFIKSFNWYLLNTDIGNTFLDTPAKEQAERMYLTAQKLYEQSRNKTQTEVSDLHKRIQELESMLTSKEIMKNE